MMVAQHLQRLLEPCDYDDVPVLAGRALLSKEHLAFGRGAHVCVGAPLARAWVRVILDRFLEQTSQICLSETEHGKPGNRNLDYEPSFIVRGLAKMYIDLKPSH